MPAQLRQAAGVLRVLLRKIRSAAAGRGEAAVAGVQTLYADVFAGQHMLVVEDIGRITASKLDRIHARLESLREMANAALRQALCGKLGLQPAAGSAGRAERGRPA